MLTITEIPCNIPGPARVGLLSVSMKHGFALGLLLLLSLPAPAAIDFSHQIVPILRQHCADCHLGDKKKGSLSLNTRKSLLDGSENGEVVALGHADKSLLIELLTSTDKDKRMPPKGGRVPPEQIELLKQWINEGAPWEDGFTFGKSAYEPPLKPRAVTLPKAIDGREHPVDRILDTVMAAQKRQRPAPLGDAAFIHRVSMDLVGLLPDPDEVDAFVADPSLDKRDRLVVGLLARDVDYAEHWLSFWNDLLRNDYVGTGYTDGGRKAITNWLYQSLVANKPYDQFTRELVAPQGADSEGFSYGIKWRGSVNASQVREVQFSQSISQIFLGINMKCASCHDSFIDRWKLADAYGLAAIYSDHPLEINRCDKPVGKVANAAWIFPELGQIDPAAPQPQRLKQLAALMTHKDNGRFTRTLVNRLWLRLMGRGIVHPVDAMHTAPWNADLLDFLAERFRTDGYDIKKMLAFITASQAYQSVSTTSREAPDAAHFVYTGPVARRLTAEQFVDAVWHLTGTGPKAPHASILRGKPDPAARPTAKWIWSGPQASGAAGETITVRKRLKLAEAPVAAKAVITADNEYQLFVNNRLIGSDANLATAETYAVNANLRKGDNTIMIVVKNGGSAPNPAGVWFEAQLRSAHGTRQTVVTDSTWEWTPAKPDDKGKFASPPKDWAPAAEAANQHLWDSQTAKSLQIAVSQSASGVPSYVRASLVTSDLLMRALGRPNREQIVTVRPDNLTTLEAIDLENGNILAGLLKSGAATLLAQHPGTSEELIQTTFKRALSRPPNKNELAIMLEVLGLRPTPQSLEDMLWSVLLLPEFQFLR